MINDVDRLREVIKQVRLVREENANSKVSDELEDASASLQTAVDLLEKEENLNLPQ
ncbi:hypothetical protein [Haloarcula argentinensis]|uniref:hypothetical protein n=1 Tax=Haloarcula argentinensis TaxID=43776 RepID=UPI000AC201AF|nr:hypothetical protein [Haloarcula argentinensis]